MPSKQRPIPEINAGSMADIAFLLLIFFLVTTTMDTDTGLKASLPPMPPENVQDPPPVNKRNVFEIKINSSNQLLVEGELYDVNQLKDYAVRFITNKGKDENLSDNPSKAVISLQNDKGTEYDIYVQVQDRLRQAYAEVRNKEAEIKYGRAFKDLTDAEQKIIKDMYPQKISEAEPKETGAPK